MLLQRIANQGIRLGTLFDRAASRHPANIIILDHDLDIAPELGRRATLTEIANLVDDFASRLWATNVRPGTHVVIYKSNGFDITLLACAVARIGAVPVLLSPKLDGTTVAELLRRVDRPHLVTDQTKLDDSLPASVFDLAEHVLLTSGSYQGATALRSLAGVERVAAVTMSPDHPTLIAHPNTFMRWEELVDDRRQPLENVKYFSSTFDAIHPRTIHRLLSASRRRAPLFAQLYGQSEVGPIAGRTYDKNRGTAADGRCVGFPFPGMTDIRVVSRDGNPPSKSSPGDIEVRSDGRIVTYLGEHERYEKQTNDDWWRMGDVGYRTKWGCMHLLDRAVDLIPGIDSTLAVEDTLFARMDELIEVIIVPDEDGTAVPVVCTRDGKPVDRIAWKAAVAGLPTMADPVQWLLEDLPQTATTKIKRLELAKLLRAGNQGK